MGPGDLSRVLAPLPLRSDPRLIVGRETFDDAGVVLLPDGSALVQTVDFFAPIVDDPYTFGQIAAANALSDVYAMGGEPFTVMNIVGFPSGTIPLEVLTEILRGGQDKAHEAGALVVGGHSVIDDEVKYGLAVTGRADPDRLLTNAAAAPGDVLFLTKPLGTGILTTAAKRGALDAEVERAMLHTMRALNSAASRAALAVGSRCATDITGFGLLGHASHIARASRVTIRIDPLAVPVLAGAVDAWKAGSVTGGAERNQAYLQTLVDWRRSTEVQRGLLVDPQTSGGLLVAVPERRAEEFAEMIPGAARIGEVLAPGERPLVLA